MKQTLTDANFPRTADLRVYHLGLRPGEVANRIVTVGSPSRARVLASHFDASPKHFELASERGFLTITGRYKGVPVSVISIGMGHPNVDFFVREVRECIGGDMYIVRLGSCGGLIDVPVGSVVVPKSSVAVERNLDFDFVGPEGEGSAAQAYRVSKLAYADEGLHAQVLVPGFSFLSAHRVQLLKSIVAAKPKQTDNVQTMVVGDCSNASADSFYSSQGRQTSFPDHNKDLIEHLQSTIPDLASFEMETFWIYHLARCWSQRPHAQPSNASPPLATSPVTPNASADSKISASVPLAGQGTVIRAASAQMIFAARGSRDFITPAQVDVLEEWTGRGVLDALVAMDIPAEKLHPEAESVWAL
ncbi:Uridine phosphorylase [Mycena kentingensis (nom. inval.)]|nr:Uridine phosphorylase [Mycena kentingensis (nom. inval.)]